jgi:hypothetical protein
MRIEPPKTAKTNKSNNKKKMSKEDFVQGADSKLTIKPAKKLRSKAEHSIGIKLFSDEYKVLKDAVEASEYNVTGYIRYAIELAAKHDKRKRAKEAKKKKT